MKNIVGLIKDINPVNAPQGDKWEHAKNILISRGWQSVRNEDGFNLKNDWDKPVIGAVGTNTGIVLCFTDNNTSDIKFVDKDYNVTAIATDDADLGFRLDKPIEGVFKYNAKGELIVAITDNFNTIKVINISNPLSPFSASTTELFPDLYQTSFVMEISKGGGQLNAGVYIFTGKYTSKKGIESQWITREAPVFITENSTNESYEDFVGSLDGEITQKSINLSIKHSANLDNFDTFQLAVISKINGSVSANIIANIPLSSTTTDFTYTGSELLEEISLDELLIDTAVYQTAKSITSYNGDLVLGNLTRNADFNYQKYANNIKIKCKAEAIKIDSFDYSSKTNIGNREEKSFMPREVYSFYIYFQLKKGGISKLYHIPGVDETTATVGGSSPTDNTTIPDAITNLSTPKRFQIEDTISNDPSDLTYTTSSRGNDVLISNMGYWENSNENYPADESSEVWDSGGDTGVDLSGTPVRHHKFPSLKFLGDNALGTALGSYELALLGIRVEDVYVPTEIQDQIIGWDIAYVKRNYANMTVFAQDKLDYTHDYDFAGDFTVDALCSLGFNANYSSGTTGSFTLYTLNDEYCRGHAQDLLFNKPDITPDYIANDVAVRITATSLGAPIEDNNYSLGDANRIPERVTLDMSARYSHLRGGISLTFPSLNNSIRAIDGWQYLASNSRYENLTSLDVTNVFREEAIHYRLMTSGNLLRSGSAPNLGTPTSTNIEYIDSYETNLISYCKLRDNVNFNFRGDREIVVIGDKSTGVLTTKDLFGGDVFMTDTCHRHTSFIGKYPITPNQDGFKAVLENSYPSTNYWFYNTFIDIMFLSYTANNWGLRAYDPTDPLTKFFPKVKTIDRATENKGDKDWKLLYNRDYTSINVYNQSSVYDYSKTDEGLLPYRVHAGKARNPDNDISINWASFLPREYYEMLDRSKGEIVKITNFNRILFIHQEYSLFIAKVKDRFIVSSEEVFLGDSSIFDRQPDELAPDTYGYAGNQSQFATIVCKLGYCFVDRSTGRVFIYNKGLKEISNLYIRQYLLDNLNYTNTTDNPYNESGLTMMYDEKWERLIIGKIDYVPTFSYLVAEDDFSNVVTGGDDYFLWKGRYYKLTIGVSGSSWDTPTFLISAVEYHGVASDLTDEALFTNNSFTISYNPYINQNRGGWVCLHDYYPNYMFNLRDKQYVIKNSNDLSDDMSGLFEMNDTTKKGLYCEQTTMPIGVNTYYDSLIDFIQNVAPDTVKRYSSFIWDTDIINNLGKIIEKETIDKILIYNNNQCSGEITIDTSNRFDKNVTNQKGTWYFNKFRDIVADSDLAFIDDDKNIISGNLNNSKAFFDNSNFISKFVIVRLQKTNDTDNKTIIINKIGSLASPIKTTK